MTRKSMFLVAALVFGLLIAQGAFAQSYSYAVKFVCGYNPSNVGMSIQGNPEGEPSVKFGNYATEINIVNANFQSVDIEKNVIVLVENGKPVAREPNKAGVSGNDNIFLDILEGTMDDCNRIWELVFGGPVPNPYPLTIGFLIVRSPIEIDVTAVYTAQTCANWDQSPVDLECLDPSGQFTDASVSIDVEQIRGRQLP